MSYALFVGSAYMWIEGTWQPGAWQWVVLAALSLAAGIVLTNWDRWFSKFGKPRPVDLGRARISAGRPTAKGNLTAIPPTPWYRKLWSKIWPWNLKGIKEKLNLALLLKIASIACVVLFLFWIFEDIDDKWIWIHPSLPESEQQRIRNECRMKSFEVIEFRGGRLSDSMEYNRTRRNYVDSCLKSRGFKLYILD